MSDPLHSMEHIQLLASTQKLEYDLKKAHEIIRDLEDRIRELEQWVDSTRELNRRRERD